MARVPLSWTVSRQTHNKATPIALEIRARDPRKMLSCDTAPCWRVRCCWQSISRISGQAGPYNFSAASYTWWKVILAMKDIPRRRELFFLPSAFGVLPRGIQKRRTVIRKLRALNLVGFFFVLFEAVHFVLILVAILKHCSEDTSVFFFSKLLSHYRNHQNRNEFLITKEITSKRYFKIMSVYAWPPLGSSGQGSWLHIQMFRVRLLVLPDFLRSTGSRTGYTASWVQLRS
jgi:hypothetical protein